MKATPSRRPDIFPEFKPLKPQLPQPMPGDPEMPNDEEEEEEKRKKVRLEQRCVRCWGAPPDARPLSAWGAAGEGEGPGQEGEPGREPGREAGEEGGAGPRVVLETSARLQLLTPVSVLQRAVPCPAQLALSPPLWLCAQPRPRPRAAHAVPLLQLWRLQAPP